MPAPSKEPQVIDRRVSDAGTAASIREVSRLANRILRNDLIAAVLRGPLSVVFPGAGTVRVLHGLGRPATGYIVTRLTASAVVSDGAFVTGDDPSLAAYLASTAACTALILFF